MSTPKLRFNEQTRKGVIDIPAGWWKNDNALSASVLGLDCPSSNALSHRAGVQHKASGRNAEVKPGFLAPRGTLDKKPPHGAPCNRCGLCCVATVCPLGTVVFGRSAGPCPALSYEGEQSTCGLVASPMKYAMALTLRNGVDAMRQAAMLLIGSSTGCDARFNGEKPNEAFYAKLFRLDEQTRSLTKAAKKLWGVP